MSANRITLGNQDAAEHQRKLKNKILHLKRGFKAMPVSAQWLLDFFKRLDGSRAFTCEGLPPDAEITAVEVDRKTGQIIIILTSIHFPASVLETRIPWLDVRFTT